VGRLVEQVIHELSTSDVSSSEPIPHGVYRGLSSCLTFGPGRHPSHAGVSSTVGRLRSRQAKQTPEERCRLGVHTGLEDSISTASPPSARPRRCALRKADGDQGQLDLRPSSATEPAPTPHRINCPPLRPPKESTDKGHLRKPHRSILTALSRAPQGLARRLTLGERRPAAVYSPRSSRRDPGWRPPRRSKSRHIGQQWPGSQSTRRTPQLAKGRLRRVCG
jgi:hypothetical protein